ncbi:hypothetical protein TYRP_004453 [Tyrophagus putrescentiae]|nr:hypothetical protein TYRP_004453 [Tyrophagus putrescentiae]
MDDGMSAAGADAASVLWCKKVSERGRGLVFLFDLSAAAAAVAVVASTAAKAIISSDGQAGCH